jgi:hypothetical protein
MTPAVPASAVTTVTNDPLPAMSPVAFDPQPEYAEPSITTHQREDGRRLDFLGDTDARSAFSSTETCIHISSQIRLVHAFFMHHICDF